MKIVRHLIKIVIIGIALFSFAPHLFPKYWLTDIFSNFKLQYLILLLLVLPPAYLFLGKRRLFFVAIVLSLLVWNSSYIIPLYLKDSKSTQPSENQLSILSINLLASNSKYFEALNSIREKDPDVVILLELSPLWEEQMQVLYPTFPYRQMYPQLNNFGIGILSKIKMNSSVTDFESRFPPSILSELEINNKKVYILATHPVPPVGQEMFRLRNEQMEEISELSKFYSNANFIVAGDLNTSSYSKHFMDLLENGNLKDSRKGFGILPSWPTDILVMRTTLDHFLFKGKMQVLERTTGKSIGSDHLPIYLKVGL